MIVIILLIPAGVSRCVDLPEPTESSTSNPGTTGTSDSTSDSTNQPTDSQSQTQTTSSSSQSNAATPKASAITDQVASMTFTESQVNPSKPVSALIAVPREMRHTMTH